MSGEMSQTGLATTFVTSTLENDEGRSDVLDGGNI